MKTKWYTVDVKVSAVLTYDVESTSQKDAIEQAKERADQHETPDDMSVSRIGAAKIKKTSDH